MKKYKMKTGTYETSMGSRQYLTQQEVRKFSYIELDFGHDSIGIKITKKQAVEIFKLLDFKVNYSVINGDLYINNHHC